MAKLKEITREDELKEVKELIKKALLQCRRRNVLYSKYGR